MLRRGHPSAKILTGSRISGAMISVVDCRDSYVFNLVAMLRAKGQEVSVIDESEVGRLSDADAVVLSPGPGRPSSDRGSCIAAERFIGSKPILGVCLGHQVVSAVLGGRVVQAFEPSHGDIVRVKHDGEGLFEGIPDGFRAVRYNSLKVDPDIPGAGLSVDAIDDSGDVMALSDGDRCVYGVQFHPESFMTEHGGEIVDNFIEAAEQWRRRSLSDTSRRCGSTPR